MNEILFRGKRIDNGEWVEGYLLLCDERVFILPKESVGCWHFDWLKKGEYIFGKFIEVIPETVGQYTGLTDKNGKKAFEHDVTEDAWGRKWVIFATPGGFGICREVEWLNGKQIYHGLSELQNAEWFKENHIIVGNIDDNPELLNCKYTLYHPNGHLCGAYNKSKRKDGKLWAHYPECKLENCPLRHPELLEGAILEKE